MKVVIHMRTGQLVLPGIFVGGAWENFGELDFPRYVVRLNWRRGEMPDGW